MIRSMLAVFMVFACAAFADADDAKPIKALLITGGCCHDYAYQSKKLVEASKKHANFEWTVLHDPRKGTKGEIDLYDDPDWAKPFDVVVHNECFAATSDPEYIRKITAAHKAGAPAVVIHCAMHTYRSAKIDDWREFLGVSSYHHEHQSEYPLTLTEAGKKHPTMVGFPADYKTPKDELYIVKKVWPNTVPLVTGKSEKNGAVHPGFWVSTYGKARVFGTTFGHSNAMWDDAVFLDTVTRGILWAAGRLGDDGKVTDAAAAAIDPNCKLCDAKMSEAMNALAAGGSLSPKLQTALANYHALHAAPVNQSDWSHSVKLPDGEKAVSLFNGKDLTGWTGLEGRWKVADGVIVGWNDDKVPTSTYLFTDKSYRNFRLLLEAKQTRSPKHSTMHSAICALGERFTDKGENTHGFKGPLLMCLNDWGIWDAYRRNRIEPAGHRGTFNPKGVEKVGDWNRIEILVIGERIRFVANGKLVFDYTEKDPKMLKASPIGLQLHSSGRPQEHAFRGLVIAENPTDQLLTLDR